MGYGYLSHRFNTSPISLWHWCNSMILPPFSSARMGYPKMTNLFLCTIGIVQYIFLGYIEQTTRYLYSDGTMKIVHRSGHWISQDFVDTLFNRGKRKRYCNDTLTSFTWNSNSHRVPLSKTRPCFNSLSSLGFLLMEMSREQFDTIFKEKFYMSKRHLITCHWS